MTTALASQLKAIRSVVQGEPAASKRPFTRPSILFDAKEAADINVETLHFIAVSGLDALIETDTRFTHYKNTLFSHRSVDMDRDVMTVEENKKINSSLTSYLRLLSAYLQLSSAQKTLEYLIRRYKVYTYNIHDLILCILPYHDTHVFVRVVQILDLSQNKLWGFLEGVKVSGAPMPRKTLVQQCIRDVGIVDAICSYVMPGNKFLHSQTVISFCTAIFVETFGCMVSVDNDMVKRILPFVFACLNPSVANGDYMACAMMIVGVIASRTTLAPCLVHDLITAIAKIVQQEGKDLGDVSWLHTSLMGIVNLVQSQSVKLLPWKCVKILKEIREISGVINDLVKGYNIEKFLAVYLESLVHHCNSDASCHQSLIGLIEIVPVRNCVVNIICKLLGMLSKVSVKTTNPGSTDSASWASKVLLALEKKYPNELTRAVHDFLQNQNVHRRQSDIPNPIEGPNLMFDGGQMFPLELYNLKLMLALEHPKVEVRRVALLDLGKTIQAKHDSLKDTLNIQAALLKGLQDDDLTVVQVVLSVDRLFKFIDPTWLVKSLQDVISKCVGILRTGNSGLSSLANDVAVACLVHGLNVLKEDETTQKEIAAMFFPLLLVLPKTWRLNLRALELVKDLQWPLYKHLLNDLAFESSKETKALETVICPVNKKTIEVLSQNFVKNVDNYITWLVQCSEGSQLSKLFFLMIMLESFLMEKKAKGGNFLSLFEACFPILKSQCLYGETRGDVLAEEVLFKMEELDDVFSDLNMYRKIDSESEAMVDNLIASIFWVLLDVFSRSVQHSDTAKHPQWNHVHEILYVFFATSRSKHLFKKHLHLLLMGCGLNPVPFLAKFYMEDTLPVSVQAESLRLLATLCSVLTSSAEIAPQNVKTIDLLFAFPSVFVPLCSASQAVRVAGVDCLEGLYNLWCHMSISSKRNGSKNTVDDGTFLRSYGEVLELIVQQKAMISLNPDFFSSFLKASLSSRVDLFVPQNLDKRFDYDKKIEIMRFILKSAFRLPHHGKLALLSMLKGVGNSSLFIEETKPLLSELMGRKSLTTVGTVSPEQNLSDVEIQILCVLLENWTSFPCPHDGEGIADNVFKVLQVPNTCNDAAIIKPCLAILHGLASEFYVGLRTEMQDQLFQHLVLLARHDISEIQRASKDLMMKLNINTLTICKHLDLIHSYKLTECRSPITSKKSKIPSHRGLTLFAKEDKILHFLFSLLDLVLLKRELEERHSLVASLVELLNKSLDTEWISSIATTSETCDVASVYVSPSIKDLTYDLQRSILSVLEDIAAVLLNNHPSENLLLEKVNFDLLLQFMHRVEDCTARVQAFSFLTSLTKLVPGQITDHLIDICVAIGESTVKQGDNHSHKVFDDLICTLVPCWFSKSHGAEELLQIFVEILPRINENRRVALVSCLLRALGEGNNLGLLLVLLFRSIVRRTKKVSAKKKTPEIVEKEWEYTFADQICLQFNCKIWLPSFIDVFKKIGASNSSLQANELQVILRFILQKLEDTELVFKLEASDDIDNLQGVFCELIEHVVLHWQSLESKMKQIKVPASIRHDIRSHAHLLLEGMMKHMVPAALFGGISNLLENAEGHVKQKALGLLYDYLKTDSSLKKHSRRQGNERFYDHDPKTNESFDKMALKVIELVNDPSDMSVKLAAASAIEAMAEKYPCNDSTLLSFLAAVSKQICSEEFAVSSGFLRSTGSLVRKLGVGTLPLLPSVTTQVLKRADGILACADGAANGDDLNEIRHRDSVILCCLLTLEALVDGLGDFLNPYLEDIVRLLILNQEFISESDHTIRLKASAVRGLLSEKISVRLILMPLLKIYPMAVNCGESSLFVAFEMIAALINKMDRPSVVSSHAKIFEKCLVALDVRRERPDSIKSVDLVEDSVIRSMVLLTMKLTEGLFKPLFIRSLDWADSELEEVGPTRAKSTHRSIAFYKLVNKLAEQHRSLFVPYFKYLTESCIHHLTCVSENFHFPSTKKQKKAKVTISDQVTEDVKPLTAAQWHLRALVISSLHKCFLYDTGNLKFLDSSTFQVLLKPIVSQFIVEPPISSDQNAVVPTVQEVDDLLVSCVGQMAVTAGSDLLWKPLNHEVLMQTRNEKIRPRILGLKVVRYLLENLKEEYLVFLPETIPFIGELLEDAELQVKSFAQDILREMESLSGENLRQYL